MILIALVAFSAITVHHTDSLTDDINRRIVASPDAIVAVSFEDLQQAIGEFLAAWNYDPDGSCERRPWIRFVKG